MNDFLSVLLLLNLLVFILIHLIQTHLSLKKVLRVALKWDCLTFIFRLLIAFFDCSWSFTSLNWVNLSSWLRGSIQVLQILIASLGAAPTTSRVNDKGAWSLFIHYTDPLIINQNIVALIQLVGVIQRALFRALAIILIDVDLQWMGWW